MSKMAEHEYQQRMAADQPEPETYELWGRVFGTHGGRVLAMPIDSRNIWPDGTALFVKVQK